MLHHPSRRLSGPFVVLLALSCAASAHAQSSSLTASDQGAGEESSGKIEPKRFEWLVANADFGYRALDPRITI